MPSSEIAVPDDKGPQAAELPWSSSGVLGVIEDRWTAHDSQRKSALQFISDESLLNLSGAQPM